MLRSFLTILIVIIMVTAPAHTAVAESRALYLPAVGRYVSRYGTVFGSAACTSGRPASGVWLWIGDYSTIVGRNGTFVGIAPAGIVTAIYYGDHMVSVPFTVPDGTINVGGLVLPC